ncbi:hypothetical protein [Streptomyces sp. NPDC015125]|uniref:hypothetical protein n=1 Tax=Streptomyces sp. NPDC015125 TaxID=3364938 RepID=UPI0036F690D1
MRQPEPRLFFGQAQQACNLGERLVRHERHDEEGCLGSVDGVQDLPDEAGAVVKRFREARDGVRGSCWSSPQTLMLGGGPAGS